MKKSSNITARSPSGQGGRAQETSGAHDHELEIARARARLPSSRSLNELAGLFDVLSNPTRLRIVLALRDSTGDESPELCVSDLAELIDASESLTSHQLRVLREAHLVTQRKVGKLVLYHLVSGPVEHLLGDGLLHTNG